jgi:beta-lactam-binding protein with PASTA domain
MSWLHFRSRVDNLCGYHLHCGPPLHRQVLPPASYGGVVLEVVRRVVPTTTVPPVIGVDQGEVAGHLAGSGLVMGIVTRVASPVRAGIVIAQNSPAGTIEPAGSPVNLTISLGPAVTVPDLEGDTAA